MAAAAGNAWVSIMWVVALEALVALCLLLLIVWLTMGSSRRRDEETPPQLEQKKDPAKERD